MAENIGTVIAVSGPAVDIQFEEKHMPPIFQALRITSEGFNVPTPLNVVVDSMVGAGTVLFTAANTNTGTTYLNGLNANLFSTVSANKLNEFHVTYSRENRPRSAVPSSVPADTAMGFATTFRFGWPVRITSRSSAYSRAASSAE